MSDVHSPEFNALQPPTVDQPTFTPPVAEPAWGPPTTPTAPPSYDPSGSLFPAPAFPPPPPGAGKPSKVKRNVLIGLAVLFGLGVIGAAGGSDDTDTGTVAAAGEVTEVTSGSSTGSSTGSSSGLSTGSSSSGSSSGSEASMVSWVSLYGDDITDIGDTMDTLGARAGNYDVSGMVSSCRTLKRQVTTALSHPPMPDASVNTPYASALSYYEMAADACISGGTNFDADDLSSSVTYLELGNSALSRATSALSKYTD